jgi:hypothetical protein
MITRLQIYLLTHIVKVFLSTASFYSIFSFLFFSPLIALDSWSQTPWRRQVELRVSTEFRQHGIPRNFLTSEVISAKFRRNSAKFRGIPRKSLPYSAECQNVTSVDSLVELGYSDDAVVPGKLEDPVPPPSLHHAHVVRKPLLHPPDHTEKEDNVFKKLMLAQFWSCFTFCTSLVRARGCVIIFL